MGTKFSFGDLDGTVVPSRSLGADFTSSALDLGADQEVAIQAVWSGADAATGSLDIWVGVDGTHFEAFPESLYTLTTAAGNHVWRVILGAIPYVQVVYKHGGNTTGTFTVVYRSEKPI